AHHSDRRYRGRRRTVARPRGHRGRPLFTFARLAGHPSEPTVRCTCRAQTPHLRRSRHGDPSRLTSTRGPTQQTPATLPGEQRNGLLTRHRTASGGRHRPTVRRTRTHAL